MSQQSPSESDSEEQKNGFELIKGPSPAKLVKFKFWIVVVATVIGNIQCKNILKLFPG